MYGNDPALQCTASCCEFSVCKTSPAQTNRDTPAFRVQHNHLPPRLQVYRNLLRGEFTSGRLEAAPSKAAVLAELCERVRFDDEAAKALHASIYRQKLTNLLEKKKLTGGGRTCLLSLFRNSA